MRVRTVSDLLRDHTERMTRFELAITFTLAKVVVTVRTVRLVLRSAPRSAKPSVQSVSSVQFV